MVFRPSNRPERSNVIICPAFKMIISPSVLVNVACPESALMYPMRRARRRIQPRCRARLLSRPASSPSYSPDHCGRLFLSPIERYLFLFARLTCSADLRDRTKSSICMSELAPMVNTVSSLPNSTSFSARPRRDWSTRPAGEATAARRSRRATDRPHKRDTCRQCRSQSHRS